MWVYIREGMVSVVKHRDKNNHLLLRARDKAHIESFIGDVEDINVFHLNDADYRFRAVITKIDFDRMLLAQADKIDYPDFKGSLPDTNDGNRYHHACTTAWHAMNNTYN